MSNLETRSFATQIVVKAKSFVLTTTLIGGLGYAIGDFLNIVPGILNNPTATQELADITKQETKTIEKSNKEVLDFLNADELKGLKVAYTNASQDGIINKTERNAMCETVQGNEKGLDAMDKIISEARSKRIPKVRLSSHNLGSCSRV